MSRKSTDLGKIIYDSSLHSSVVHASVPAAITEERENSFYITPDNSSDELQSENLVPGGDNPVLKSTD